MKKKEKIDGGMQNINTSIKNKIIMSLISMVCFLITKFLLILIGLYRYVRGYGWLLKTVKQSKKILVYNFTYNDKNYS